MKNKSKCAFPRKSFYRHFLQPTEKQKLFIERFPTKIAIFAQKTTCPAEMCGIINFKYILRMKKSTILFMALLLLVVTACRNNRHDGQTEETEPLTGLDFDTLNIVESYPMDSMDANSPKLDINISLLIPRDKNETALANKNNCISYAAYSYEGIPPQAATDSIIKSLKDNYYAMRDDYFNEKNVNPDAPWFSAYYLLKSNAISGRDNVVCYTVFYEVYEGGVHPNHLTSVVNFDATSGKEIGLQDVFTENCDSILIARLTNRLAEQHNAKSLEELQEKGYLTMNDMYVTNNFVLGKDSIFFIYNSYEIAPYAYGDSHIGFKYEELKDILK